MVTFQFSRAKSQDHSLQGDRLSLSCVVCSGEWCLLREARMVGRASERAFHPLKTMADMESQHATFLIIPGFFLRIYLNTMPQIASTVQWIAGVFNEASDEVLAHPLDQESFFCLESQWHSSWQDICSIFFYFPHCLAEHKSQSTAHRPKEKQLRHRYLNQN